MGDMRAVAALLCCVFLCCQYTAAGPLGYIADTTGYRNHHHLRRRQRQLQSRQFKYKDLKVKWSSSLETSDFMKRFLPNQPVCFDETYSVAFVLSNSYTASFLNAVNTTNGVVLWISPLDKLSIGASQLFDRKVIISTETGVSARSAQDGSEVWQAQLSYGSYPSSPVAVDSRSGAAYVISDEAFLSCLDAKTGTLRWEVRVGLAADEDEKPVVSKDCKTVFVVTDAAYAVCARTGQIKWRSLLGGIASAPILTIGPAANAVYVTVIARLFALDANSGALLWTYDSITPAGLASGPAFVTSANLQQHGGEGGGARDHHEASRGGPAPGTAAAAAAAAVVVLVQDGMRVITLAALTGAPLQPPTRELMPHADRKFSQGWPSLGALMIKQVGEDAGRGSAAAATTAVAAGSSLSHGRQGGGAAPPPCATTTTTTTTTQVYSSTYSHMYAIDLHLPSASASASASTSASASASASVSSTGEGEGGGTEYIGAEAALRWKYPQYGPTSCCSSASIRHAPVLNGQGTVLYAVIGSRFLAFAV